ncbi:MAG: acyl-CoA dehydrogenase family protein [Salinisphaera sp.]|nr:acyl-CoA dehydrogenase family protein [Salinisphaera sp.]
MINLEEPKRYRGLTEQAHQVALEVFRPVSRRYDLAEHEYPKELDTLAALLDGMNAGAEEAAGIGELNHKQSTDDGVVNGRTMAAVLSMTELCWGDVGLALSLPRQGLGNAAISAVANDEQAERFKGCWAAMAITEPGAGSDSAAITTRAVEDGDDFVLNGEKIFVTAGGRCDTVVVWATLDPKAGRAAIKSFVIPKGTPGMEVVRLDHKMGIRASDTASIRLTDCRVPKENLLGSREIDTKRSFAGVMKTFDNTRPLVAAMAIGLARASLEETRRLLGQAGIEIDYQRPAAAQSAAAAAFMELEADWEAARLLTLQAAWMADNNQPNSLHASMAKAKAGRMGAAVTLGCIELIGPAAYGEDSLLEKWARDAKILDIFEGTQQIQLLIIARRLLGKTSSELR